MDSDIDATAPRFASRGRAFAYVLPCRDQDLLKVGFSRDPVQRLQALHRRFFAYFDLDRAFLIATDSVRDARRVERRFITSFAEARSPAPLVVPDAAAGYTEWYRGVYPALAALARDVCAFDGLVLHAPLRDWLRGVFDERSTLLYAWSEKMLDAIEYARCNAPSDAAFAAARRALVDALDCYVELGIDIQVLVPEAVFSWYRNNGGR
jgi:hypothetical protein